MENNEQQYSVEYYYQRYLQQMELREQDMTDNQRMLMRLTFYAGFWQMIILYFQMKKEELPIEQVGLILSTLVDQCAAYFLDEIIP